MKIRKGDRVAVLSGKDRRHEGVVTEVYPDQQRVTVEGANTVRRHTRPRSAEEPGGIIDIDKPIHVSNVAVLSPKDNKPTRVGYKMTDAGKVRICKRTGVEIPEASE